MKMFIFRALGVFGVAFGAFWILLPFFYWGISKSTHSVSADAEVIDIATKDIQSVTDQDEVTTYYAPVVQYTIEGQDYTVESSSFSKNVFEQKGDKVVVYYDPSNPAECLMERDVNLTAIIKSWWFIIALGAAFVVISISWVRKINASATL